VLQWAAHIRYYYKIDPADLTDDEFARAWAQLFYTMKVTGKIEEKK
jgi:hypothetical protein